MIRTQTKTTMVEGRSKNYQKYEALAEKAYEQLEQGSIRTSCAEPGNALLWYFYR